MCSTSRSKKTAPRRHSDHEELLIMKDKFSAVLWICRHRSRLPRNVVSDHCHWQLEYHRNFLRRRGLMSFLSFGVQTSGVARSPPQTQSLDARGFLISYWCQQPLDMSCSSRCSSTSTETTQLQWRHASISHGHTNQERRSYRFRGAKNRARGPDKKSSTKLKASVRGGELCVLSPYLPAVDLASTKVVDHRKC